MAKTQWQKDPNHGFIWNCIDHLATWYDGREKHAVNRKTYLLSLIHISEPTRRS